MSTNINSTEQIVEINAGDQITNVNIVSQSTTQVISGEQVVTVDVNAGTIPAAWGSITGTLSNQTDLQNALNAKQNNITLTTTGTTGVATLVGSTLNIPNYVSSTKQTQWDSAYNDKINSAEVSGTTTKTLTLTQQDGGIIQASWSDFDTAPVTSVFGRTGNVVAAEGDYNINQLGDVTITTATNGQVLKYNGTAWVNAADASGLTSVGLAMPSAFTVSGSPLTSNGTITVTGAGTTSQYVRGDGSLATFPTTSNEAKTLIREVYNKTGATLTKGTVIYIDGGQGNLPTVTKAIATGDPTSAQTFGIVQSDITNMNNGFVVVAGGIDNLDTQAYTEGTALYLSPTTAGAWTSTKPYAPDHMVYLGVVVRSHPTQGVIEVKIQNGVEIDEIHNVSARFPTNKDGLFYNSTSNVWENKSIAGVLGYTPVPESRIITINGTAQNLSADRTWNVGTVTSVAASGGTGISISGSPVTGSGTISITNTAPDQIVSLTGAGTTSISGTYPNFTVTSNDQYVGTVTSVNATVPTGFEVSGVPITSSGTVDIKFASGYSLPTNAKQTQWDDAYAKRIDSLTVTGNSGSATLTSNVLNVPTYTLTGLGGEPAITAGTTSQYFRGDKTFQTLDTSVVPENGNVYFTEPRVRATVLSGLNITGGSISASDSVLNAFGKVQNQINGLIGGSIFQSTWNASTNTPTLASGVGTKGYYYIVSVAGTTNLDGITDWQIGDWAIFDGTVWRKVDNTDAVVSVNGYTGVVNLVLDDLADVSAASPTDTQLLRFNGTTSKWYNWTPNYQTQLTNPVTGTGTTNRITYWDSSATISALDTASYPTLTELSYVKGVTSSIQTQINGKLSLTGGTLTGSLSGTSGSFSGVMNADEYNMAAWRILDWSGDNALIGGINANQWTQVEIYTSGTSKVKIDTNGKVGIGMQPVYTLDVSGTGRFNNEIYVAAIYTPVIGPRTNGGTISIYDWNSATIGTINTSTKLFTYNGAISSGAITATGSVTTSGSGSFIRPAQYSIIGGSGGDYGSVGYNIEYTSTSNSYKYSYADFSSMIRFDSGGFVFKTAGSGTVGNAITYTDVLTILQGGNATFSGTLSASNLSGTNTGDQTTITGNAGSATVLQTARNFTINGTAKSFDGSANVSWTAAEIGLTSYLPLAGGTLTGNVILQNSAPSFRVRSSTAANDALVAAVFTDDKGMQMLYNPSSALGYIQNTYEQTANEAFGDIHFRVNVGGTMTTRMVIRNFYNNITFNSPMIGSSTLTVAGTIYANQAGSQLQIGGGATLSGIFQGTSSNNLFIGDWVTATKGITINVSTGAVSFTHGISATSGTFSSFVQGDYFQTGSNPATSGGVRLGTQVAIRARNVANTANIPLIESTASDNVSIASGGASVGIGGTNTDSLLTINGTAGTSHERFREGSTTIGFIGGANGIITGHNGKLALRAESGLILSGTGNSPDVIIASGGAATFSSTLTVQGVGSFANEIYVNGVWSSSYGPRTNGGSINFYNWSGGTIGSISTTSNLFTYNGAITSNSYFQTTTNGSYLRAANYTWVGGSGGDYGSIGYNIGYTTTTTTYNYVFADFASMIRFDSGGFRFLTAGAGSAGGAISFATQLLITQSGAATFSSSIRSNTSIESYSSSTPIIQAVTTSGSVEAVLRAMWMNDDVGMEIRYNANTALGYVQNTYPVTSGQVWGDIHFRQKVSGSMTTRMLIKAVSGNVLIGTTTDSTGKLQVNGSIYATSFFESSDIRLKNVIEKNPRTNLNLDVLKYTRKIGDDKDQIRFGYSAQQVKELMPELVGGQEYLSVNYIDVHTLKIASLEEEIKQLKNKLNELGR